MSSTEGGSRSDLFVIERNRDISEEEDQAFVGGWLERSCEKDETRVRRCVLVEVSEEAERGSERTQIVNNMLQHVAFSHQA